MGWRRVGGGFFWGGPKWLNRAAQTGLQLSSHPTAEMYDMNINGIGGEGEPKTNRKTNPRICHWLFASHVCRASVYLNNETLGARNRKKGKKKLRGKLKIKNSSLCSQQMDPLHLHCSTLASCPLSRHAPCSLGGQGRSPRAPPCSPPLLRRAARAFYTCVSVACVQV